MVADKQKFMDPLAANQDPLNGAHANTHLPEVVGVARGWEVTGNKTLHDIAENFYSILDTNYTYSTGGSNVNEHWSSPDQLGDAIATSFDKDANTTTNSNGYHTWVISVCVWPRHNLINKKKKEKKRQT